MNEIVERIKGFLFARQQAYQQVFKKGVFTERVLKDLANFCRAHESSFHSDARIHAVLEGRREVWLRIQQHIKLTPDELWAKHGNKGVLKDE